jgi:hypothetical protein
MSRRRSPPSRPADRLAAGLPRGLVAALAFCVVAAGALAASPPTISIAPVGRVFGTGEQQVYAIERHESITATYRAPSGEMVTKHFDFSARTSVAYTVEGFSSDGAAVLALATANDASPAATPSASPTPSPSAAPSTSPSPMLHLDGTTAATGGLEELTPIALVAAGQGLDGLRSGAHWRTNGVLALPAGSVLLALQNQASTWTAPGGLEADVVEIDSIGSAQAGGALVVPGFGRAALHGGGSAAAKSYVDRPNRLLAGVMLTIASSGNLENGRGDRGSYALNARYVVKLVRLAPGLLPSPAPMLSTDVDVVHSASSLASFAPADIKQMAQPAPTDALILSSPVPLGSPTLPPSPPPEASLAPIPVTIASDAPIASPVPPPPTPTPIPTPWIH